MGWCMELGGGRGQGHVPVGSAQGSGVTEALRHGSPSNHFNGIGPELEGKCMVKQGLVELNQKRAINCILIVIY